MDGLIDVECDEPSGAQMNFEGDHILPLAQSGDSDTDIE
jgi:hypothetical protein